VKEFYVGTVEFFQCCFGSGIFIPDSYIYPSRIPDPTTATKKGGGVPTIVVLPFFVATNITKLKIILFLKRY
jgi:hypothetical protein